MSKILTILLYSSYIQNSNLNWTFTFMDNSIIDFKYLNFYFHYIRYLYVILDINECKIFLF